MPKFKSPQMLTWEKNYATCKHRDPNLKHLISDFSHYKSFDSFEKEPFFYCSMCHTHWYKGKEWNPDEWDEYVNDC